MSPKASKLTLRGIALGYLAILLVAPEIYSSLLGLALIVPVLVRQLAARKAAALSAA